MPSQWPDQSALQILNRKVLSLNPKFVRRELHSLLFRAWRCFIGRPLTQGGHPPTYFCLRQAFERLCFHIDLTGSFNERFLFQLWCFEGVPR